jgi:FkbM family methyltransferase
MLKKNLKLILEYLNLDLVRKDRNKKILNELEQSVSILNFLKLAKQSNVKEIIKKMHKSKSQLAQDIFVLDQLNFMKKGFFVEFGACDGLYLSNTYLLEKEYNWNGIVCEPAKIFYKSLKKNRNCFIENKCVIANNNYNNNKIKFVETNNNELSFVKNIAQGKNVYIKKKIYEVETISINKLLEKYNCPSKFEYLSIDTEGDEYNIIKNLNFDRYNPRVITIEHNYETSKRKNIFNLLIKKNYKRIHKDISRWDDWYIYKK